MKFGGTSVEDSAAIGRLVDIVRGRLEKKPVIVVSALSGVTSELYKIADLASKGEFESAVKILSSISARHRTICIELIPEEDKFRNNCLEELTSLMDGLGEIVRVISILTELSDRSLARIVSYGELLSSCLIFNVLKKSGVSCAYIDAREFMITDQDYLKGEPVIDEIKRRVPGLLSGELLRHGTLITQGFISSSKDGIGTILGRGGSDYSASLIGMATGAEEIEIWTDVDGVHTADPRYVNNTKSITSLSFEEAAEMAYFGAKVLHPYTIQPAIEKNIPVRVLNSRRPDHAGTLILPDNKINGDGVKAITFKECMTVINIFSTRMLNAIGFLNRVFELFSKYKISVDLISTSEVNVSVTVECGIDLREIITELSAFSTVTVRNDMSQISVVGKNLKNLRGTCKNVFGSLGEYQIYMISQGASEINLSFVVSRSDLGPVLHTLHNDLFNK
jgi:aspartate kinase